MNQILTNIKSDIARKMFDNHKPINPHWWDNWVLIKWRSNVKSNVINFYMRIFKQNITIIMFYHLLYILRSTHFDNYKTIRKNKLKWGVSKLYQKHYKYSYEYL